jgi:hypothetical protein
MLGQHPIQLAGMTESELLSTLKVDTTLSTMTVEQWLAKHIDDLTGVDRAPWPSTALI